MEAGHKDAGVLLYAHVNFGPGQSPVSDRLEFLPEIINYAPAVRVNHLSFYLP